MKKNLIAAALTLALVTPALAVDAHHPESQGGPAAVPSEQAVQKMQANAKTMQSQLDGIAKAQTPEQRQKLLMEHMQTMRENMMLGQQMAMGAQGCPMMNMMGGGMGMMGGAGMGMTGSGDTAAMMTRMHQMEQRMDMMQMMMGQMSGRSVPPAKGSK
jgi:hypothetical protein